MASFGISEIWIPFLLHIQGLILMILRDVPALWCWSAMRCSSLGPMVSLLLDPVVLVDTAVLGVGQRGTHCDPARLTTPLRPYIPSVRHSNADLTRTTGLGGSGWRLNGGRGGLPG